MAATPPTSTTTPRRAASASGAGRSTPVLVPQEALAGQPDVPLNRSVTTVGSSETCRLVLQSRTISRHHAVFLVDGGTAYVADLASRTGVLVNGKAVHEAELNPGDRIQIGKFLFRYRSAGGPAPDPTPTAPAASAVVAGLLAVPIHGRIALIGRRETSDVALVGDAGVSAAHAALFHAGGQWYVRDLGSRTGTTVNGQPIVQQAVHFGDHIGVGAATIQFEPAVAVPGHAAVETTPTVGLEPPAPLPTEIATLPLSLEGEETSSTGPASMPLGLVAATDHPMAAVLTAPLSAAAESATVDTFADALAEPAQAEPSEGPQPLPQPRSWDAIDVNEPPMAHAAPPVDVLAVPPEPKPKSWDEAFAVHGRASAAEASDDAGHGVAGLVPTETVTSPSGTHVPPQPTPFDESVIAPSAESVAGIGLAESAAPEELAPFEEPEPSHGVAELFHEASEIEPVALEPVPLVEEPTAPSDAAPVTSDAAPVTWDEPAVAEAVPEAEPVPDVVEPTEPSPDSALAWEANVASEGEPAVAPAAHEDLTDSQFGRQIDEFVAADTTGPLVEDVTPATPVRVPPPAVEAPVSAIEEPAAQPLGSELVAEAPDVQPGLPAEEVAVAAPAPHPAPYVSPGAWLSDVSDFVFVPGEAAPDTDVIFWGDPELDAVAEAAIFTPRAPVEPTPPHAEPAVVDQAPVEPPAHTASPEPTVVDGLPPEPVTDAAVPEPVTDALAPEPAAEVAPAELVAVIDDGASFADPTIEPADVPPAAYAAEPFAVELPVDVAAVVTDGAAEPAGELPVEEPLITTGELPPDVAEPDHAEHPVELADLADLLPADTSEPSVELAGVDIAHPDEALVDEALADVPLPVAAADSLSAGPFTAEPSIDLPAPTGEGAEGHAAEPVDVMPAGDADEPFAAAGEPVTAETDDFFGHDEPTAVADETVELIATPLIPSDALDPALAVTSGEGNVTAAVPTVEPIAFDDLLEAAPEATAATSAEPVPTDELSLDLPTEDLADPADGWGLNDEDVMPSAEVVEPPTAVINSDEPVGFELEADDAGSADWDDLDLLDAEPPAVATLSTEEMGGAPATTDAVAKIAEDDHAAVAHAEPSPEHVTGIPSTGGGFGAVVNVADEVVAGLSATETLAPVTDFAAVGGGAVVDTFAAVSDAVLSEPPAPEVPVAEFPVSGVAVGAVPTAEPITEDDLAFLDFGPAATDDAETSGFLSDDLPADAVAEVADEAVPSAPPELLETVVEPVVDVAPPVEDPPLQLLASVSIPPPVDEPPATPAMSGPSLFGFNFEGGSFLGGMPLPLNNPSSAPLPPGGILFDKPNAIPTDVVHPDDASDAVIPSDDELAAQALADAAQPAPVRPTTPPPLGLIGLVAGQVMPPAPESARPVAPVGLTGGSLPASPRTIPPPPVPPPGFADVGKSRSADVFSQLAGPIGVIEAFGDRPGRADQFKIPEVDRSAPQPGMTTRGDAAAMVPPPPAQRLANDERLIPADLPKRKKVRRLLVALVALPVLWSGLVYMSMGKTATVVGTLRYDGLDKQGESARRLFKGDQIKRLCGENVRSTARANLANRGKPAGPTEDGTAMAAAMQDGIACAWGDSKDANLLTVTFKAPDGDVGKAQLEALLSALRADDEPLSDTRATAIQNLAAANAAYAAAKAADDQIKDDRREQIRQAEDRPDKATVDALDRELDSANRKVASVQAERATTEAVLDGWQKQDPSKPVDPAIDPELVNLQRQLVPIQAQIAKAKQLAAMNGTQAGSGDDDPLMAVLLQQESKLKARQDQRQADLARASSIPPEERARQRETAIEQLGVKVAALKKAEADAQAAASTASAAAADAHAKVDTAHLAEARAADLYTKLMEADKNLRDAGDDQAEKQRAVDGAVIVAGSASTNPDVSVPSENDPRPMTAGVGSLLIAAGIVCWLLSVAGTGEELDDDYGGGGGNRQEYTPSDEHEPAPARAAREPVGV